MRKKLTQSGFTLIEILISLAIFAIIGVICAYALRNLINMHDNISNINKRIANLNIALVIMQRDMQQIVDRPIRDSSGHLVQSIILGGSSLEFTNSSNIDPLGTAMHSDLQRIRYQLSGDGLTREIWPVLDQPSTPVQPLQQPILGGVSKLQFQLVDENNQPQSVWPPPGAQSASVAGMQMPKAIVVTMTIKGFGELKKVIATPGDKFHAA